MPAYIYIFGGVGVFLIIYLFAKGVEKKRAAAVLKKFKNKNIMGITSSANFFGLETKGLSQIRGNGVLVLTDKVLYFEMWFPKKIVSIPLSSIVKVEMVKSHLKKTKGVPLLKVVFNDRNGARDSAAWLVNNVKNWTRSLQEASRGLLEEDLRAY